jgi:hypothetical protein
MFHLSGCSAVSCHLTVYTKFRTPSVVDAPIEDIYFNVSDVSTPLFEFSFIINPTQQQVL